MKRKMTMRRIHIASVMIAAASIFVVHSVQTMGQGMGKMEGGAVAARDRFALRAPNGIAFSEFKGYESWDVIGSSVTDDGGGCGSSPDPGCIKSIVGNTVMIKALKAGIPSNGKAVPDGAKMAKIEWFKARDPSLAYGAIVPGKFIGGRFHGEGLEAIPADQRMGVRDTQVRRRHRHVQGVRRRGAGLPQDGLSRVPRG